MRILCTADLHIGRVSSRLREGTDSTAFTTRAAWLRVVDLALTEKVDAVAVAGDVIDASGNYFEAFGPLETGLRRLSGAGIETFLVAGNHDFDSLPRFCDQFRDPRVHLLGRGGVWQRHTLAREGVPRLHIDGWSFRAADHRANPLLGYRCERDATPVLGLLHSDVEGAYSSYAPCSPAELLSAGPTLWLLGHIHRTNQWSTSSAIAFYPGSPQALDPGERGVHGAWVIDWPPGSPPALRHCPLSTMRYETLALGLDGCDDEPMIEAALHGLLEEKLRAGAAEAGPLALLTCRVRLQGRTKRHSHLARHGWPRIDQLCRTAQGVTAVIERVEVDTRPVLDLDVLSQGTSPPSFLARLLLALERGENHPLLGAAQQHIETAFRTMSVDGDSEPGGEAAPTQEIPDAARVRALLLTQGHRMLGQLVDPAP